MYVPGVCRERGSAGTGHCRARYEPEKVSASVGRKTKKFTGRGIRCYCVGDDGNLGVTLSVLVLPRSPCDPYPRGIRDAWYDTHGAKALASPGAPRSRRLLARHGIQECANARLISYESLGVCERLCNRELRHHVASRHVLRVTENVSLFGQQEHGTAGPNPGVLGEAGRQRQYQRPGANQ